MGLNKNGKTNVAANRKKLWIVPLVVVVIAAIMLLVYGLAMGSVLNLDPDVAGGYKMRIKVGSKLTDETYDDYSNKIVSIAENLTDEEGNNYGIKVTECERYGADNDSIAISYQGVASEQEMEETVNPALQKAIENQVVYLDPEVTFSHDTIVAKYNDALLTGNIGDIKVDQLRRLGVNILNYEVTSDTITVHLGASISDSLKSDVEDSLILRDEYSGRVVASGLIGSSLDMVWLQRLLLSFALILVLILVFMWIKYGTASALSAILGVALDLVITLCGMIIFYIEFATNFIISFAAVLCYSIYSILILFSSIKENSKNMPGATNADIANVSVKSIMPRSIITFVVVLLLFAVVAVIGVSALSNIMLPIIIGMLSVFYTSNFIVPSVWSWFSDNFVIKRKMSKKV